MTLRKLPGDRWTAFRNGGVGHADLKRLPERWSPTRGIAWRVSLPGYGQSCPVVWRDRVFVSAVRGAQREDCLALAFSARDGRLLWSQQIASTFPTESHYLVSRAAPTPCLDQDGLYCSFESGDIVRLSPKDGRIAWKRSLVREYGPLVNEYGLGGSPTLTRDAVVVLVDHQGPSYLLALDRRTGKTRWKTDREPRKSWTSPICVEMGGRELVIVSSNGAVDAYDAVTGTLWKRLPGYTGNIMSSPFVDEDRLYIGATTAQRDLARPGGRTPQGSNACFRFTTEKDRPEIVPLWEAKKATTDFMSPFVFRGHAYYVTAAGILYCLDAMTGEERYAERIGGICWGSPIGVGDRVYFFGKNGVVSQIRTGPKFEKIGENTLWSPDENLSPSEDYTPKNRPAGSRGAAMGNIDPVLYGAAAVEGTLFLRTGIHLYCVRG
ncbi:MAG: PQQ-binding-like beta-propeller repeat protein [Capsulimonadales bacterium]|nr:PQQ-binding-like beta-propeller repeat protein [Capsulimonadales bacterium]